MSNKTETTIIYNSSSFRIEEKQEKNKDNEEKKQKSQINEERSKNIKIEAKKNLNSIIEKSESKKKELKESIRIKKVNSIKAAKIIPESKANNNIYNNESKALLEKKPNKTEVQNKKSTKLKAKNLNKKKKK